MVYEGRAKNRFLVLPHTISMYYVLLGNMINFELSEITTNNILNSELIELIKKLSYEEKPVERRFNNIIGVGTIDNY